ncbi:MAG TPA: nuclear transport factor 2 family protein, partial [Tepidiformaceae bacterium]|nr:nuclear transport factor 2 family protein [Tepidiformaceae bacterium]
MSEENVELTYRAFDAFNRRDFDALVGLMDAGVEISSRLLPFEGSYHGHDGVRRWCQDLIEAFPDFNTEPDGSARPRKRDPGKGALSRP